MITGKVTIVENRFSRTQLLLGPDAMDKLAASHVAVFGVGGVGGYVCEALARSGVGRFDLIDADEVSLTNINRQIIATTSTVGRKKVEVMRERILDINPDAQVHAEARFFLPENVDSFPFQEYDYVVDAVDMVAAKLALAVVCQERGIALMSSMGAGNKLDPCGFKVADIFETSVCPLARVMRRELRKRGVKKLKVVYSQEVPIRPFDEGIGGGRPIDENAAVGAAVPGSTAFVPSVAGLIIASEVVKDLTSGIRRQ
ncbi:MAG: tRNA threonylcarbamoyladenosine dehydratase [Eggerthellales bacterium]|nr:tRNA threonylcarbamoyladenosine dehydratase [Eggerthellales bacterium]